MRGSIKRAAGFGYITMWPRVGGGRATIWLVSVARLLRPAPASLRDGARLALGAFAGPLPPVTFPGLGAKDDLVRRKRWVWACVSAEDLVFAFAVVRTGYAASAFLSVFDVGAFRMVTDGAWTGPAPLGRVTDDVHGCGLVARYASPLPRVRIEVTRAAPGSGLDVCVRAPGLGVELDACLGEPATPPPLAVVADLGGGDVDATEKRSLLPVRGHARLGPRRIMLDGGIGGYDYTQGLLPRRTRWRWAYGLGASTRGEPVAFNLTSGFVGEAECAVFDRAGVHGVAEPEISYDPAHPAEPWTVRGPGIDLAFRVAGVHAERRRLGVVRTDFLQPVGVFEGTLELSGRVHEVRGLPGVVEDQDVLW